MTKLPTLSEGELTSCPDQAGTWLDLETGQEVDVYPLEPCGGILCIWGPDVGLTYSGNAETQSTWDTDEWQGHIPVSIYSEVRKRSWQLVEAA